MSRPAVSLTPALAPTSACGDVPGGAQIANAANTSAMSASIDGVVASDYGWSDATPEPSHSYLDPVVLDALKEAVPAPPARAVFPAPRVFDAGCGNGALLLALRGRGYEVAGCELSAAGAEIARRALGGVSRVENLSVYEDLAGTFGSGWDAVVSTEVVEHLYAPRVFVRRARELLRVGGTLVLTTPYHGYAKNLVMALTGTLDKHFTALWDGGHIKFWSYATLKALLAEADFGDFQFRGAGRLPGLWKSMVVSARRLR